MKSKNRYYKNRLNAVEDEGYRINEINERRACMK